MSPSCRQPPREHAAPPTPATSAAFLLLTLLVLVTRVSAETTVVIDQQYDPVVRWGGAARSTDVWGQVFQPAIAGNLMWIEIDPTRGLDLNVPLVVTLRELSTLQPLASLQVPALDVSTWTSTNSHRLALDFSLFEIPLSPTNSYVIDFTSASESGYGVTLGCEDDQCTTDGYPRGYAHGQYRQRSEDFLFRTFMKVATATPQPAVLVVSSVDVDAWVGEPVSLHAAATGTLPLRFQWLKAGKPLDGATNATFSLSVVRADDAGLYSVSVSNSVGSATGRESRVAVHTGPEFLYPMQDVYVPLGEQATFTVVAAGHGSVAYQWYREGKPIAGAVGATFSFRPAINDQGTYWVAVTDQSETRESNHFRLVVRDDSARVRWKVPMYYPWSTPAVEDGGRIVTITYTGDRYGIAPDGTVDWTRKTSIGGGRSSPVLMGSGGVLFGGWGFDVLSSTTGETLRSAYRVAPLMVPLVYDAEMDRVFTIEDSGLGRCLTSNGDLVWERRLSLRPIWTPMAYSPTTRTLCVVDSEGAILGIDADTGAERWQKPPGPSVVYGQLAIDGSGVAFVSVRTNLVAIKTLHGEEMWRYSNTNWMTTEPIIGNEGVIYAGTETGIVALDSSGQRLWSTDLLRAASITPALASDGTLYVGHGPFLSALDSSTGRVLWDYLASADLRDGVAIAPDGSVLIIPTAGRTEPLDSLTALRGSFPLASTPWPKARGNPGNTGAALRKAPPILLTPPRDQAGMPGETLILSVIAAGAPPLRYQWFFLGQLIAGATNATLELPAVTAGVAGPYTVVVSNPLGVTTSAVARVVVLAAPMTWVRTVAGDGQPGSVDDPDARYGELRSPGIAVVGWNGSLFIPSGNSIRELHPDGSLTTFAGQVIAGRIDGSATDARFNSPAALALDTDGNLLVADTGNHVIRMISRATRVTTTIAGTGSQGQLDSTSMESRFNSPVGLVVDSRGVVYVTERGSHTVRSIGGGIVTTVAGKSASGFRDGAARDALFNQPRGLAMDRNDNLYIADYGNHRIRKLSTDGTVSTLAGTNSPGVVDGRWQTALLGTPASVAVGLDGTVYFVESGAHVVRELFSSAGVLTLAGGAGLPGRIDGTNGAARFSAPAGLAIGADGSLWVSDAGNHQIRHLTFTPPPDSPGKAGNLSVELRPWLTLKGTPGQGFRVDESWTPFGPWNELTNITLTTSNAGWFDPTPRPDQRYYRAVPKP